MTSTPTPEPWDETLDWAKEQLSAVGKDGVQGELILYLLEVYLPKAVRAGWTGDVQQEILGMFYELAQGHSLVVPDDDKSAVWVQAKPGNLVVADRVRVRRDAYEGSAGIMHNGRSGVITAMRYGDIYVRYTDDREPSYGGIRHAPRALEKRVK